MPPMMQPANRSPIRWAAFTAGAALVCASCSSPSEPQGPSVASAASTVSFNSVAGLPVATASLPAVRVTTASGVAVAGVPVTFTITGGGGSIASGASVTTNAAGVAVVGDWTLGPVAGANTMSAVVAALAPVTFTATGIAGPATKLVLTSAPSGTAANRAAFTTQPVVQLQDANSNAVSTAGIAVTAAIISGGGTLTGNPTVPTSAGGAATFTNLSIAGVVGARTLAFTASGLASTTAQVTTTAGAASLVTIEAGNNQVAVSGAAVATAPSVAVRDLDANAVADVAVTFAIASGGGNVIGFRPITDASGVAAVGGWTLGPFVGANELTGTVAGIAPVSFTATGTVGPAAKLVLIVSPSAAVANRAAFGSQPVVQVQDANSNVVAAAGTSVSVAITAGGGTLNGTVALSTVSNGTAAFTNLAIAGLVGPRTLTFSSTGLTAATAQVSTTAGTASVLAIDAGNNQSAVSGAVVATRPSVKVSDADANAVEGIAVTFAVTGGGGIVSGATPSTSASGIATVGDWSLGPVAGTNTMTASATGLAPVTFAATGTPGPATKLVLTSAPLGAVANRATFGTSPVVQLQDVNSNAVGTAGVSVTVAITGGGGALNGTLTLPTSTGGTATFADLAIAGLVGTRTLSFTATGLTGTTAQVTTTAGAAAVIALEAGNNQSAPVVSAVATPPSVKVTDLDANPVASVAVTFAVTGGGGSVTGASPNTDASGIAAIGSWTLGSSAGVNTLSASATGLAGSPVAFTATAVESPVQVTDVSPSPLTSGATATITGTGFSATTTSNGVTIDGLAATVTSASLTSLTVTVPALPCTPTHDASVVVTVAGFSGSRAHPVQTATLRTLAPGQSLILSSASDSRCNELSNPNQSALYYVSVSNRNTAYSTTGASFELRGATGATSLVASAKVVSTPIAPPRLRSSIVPEGELGERTHVALQERNLEFLRRNGTRWREGRSANLRAVGSEARAVGDLVALRIGDLNSANYCQTYLSVGGRVAYSGTRSIIIEDTLNQVRGIDSTYAQIGQEFDDVMWPILETNYGDPIANDASLDNNQRIVMVFSDKVATFLGGNLAGFASPCDFFQRATFASSNVGEYFYARAPSVPGTFATSNSPPHWKWAMRSTIIHEVKHIVSLGERFSRNGGTVFEESWLEETTARLSEELYERARYGFAQRANIGYGSAGNPVGPYCGVRACGGGQPRGIVRVFEELASRWYAAPHDYSPLGRIDANDFSFYATGWSLVRWALDANTGATESAMLKGMTQAPTNTGVANFNAQMGITVADAIPRWTLAMVLDDHPGFAPADALLAQPSWNLRDVYAGYDADFSVPWVGWPFAPTPSSFGAFSRTGAVRPGTAAIFQLTGLQSAKQLLELKASGSSAAAPSELRLSIVRVQ